MLKSGDQQVLDSIKNPRLKEFGLRIIQYCRACNPDAEFEFRKGNPDCYLQKLPFSYIGFKEKIDKKFTKKRCLVISVWGTVEGVLEIAPAIGQAYKNNWKIGNIWFLIYEDWTEEQLIQTLNVIKYSANQKKNEDISSYWVDCPVESILADNLEDDEDCEDDEESFENIEIPTIATTDEEKECLKKESSVLLKELIKKLEDTPVVEGKRKTEQHTKRERKIHPLFMKWIRAKYQLTGKVICEHCGKDLVEFYNGDVNKAFACIEGHHIYEFSKDDGKERTTLLGKDILACEANCHRFIHKLKEKSIDQ